MLSDADVLRAISPEKEMILKEVGEGLAKLRLLGRFTDLGPVSHRILRLEENGCVNSRHGRGAITYKRTEDGSARLRRLEEAERAGRQMIKMELASVPDREGAASPPTAPTGDKLLASG